MESVAAELAVILAAIYLLDCFRWVSRSARLFRKWPLMGARIEHPIEVAAQFSRALAFGFPLPVERLLSAEGSCLRPLDRGLWVAGGEISGWARPGRDARVVPWSDLPKVEVKGLELTGPGVRHVFGSRRAALAARRQLSVLARGDGRSPRADLVEEALGAAFDVPALDERLARWSRVRPWVALATTLLLFTMVATLGAMLVPQLAWWRFLPGVALAWVACAVTVVFGVRRALEPEVRPSVGQWMMLIVSPLSLVRGADLVEGELLADLEPLAVAAALLPRGEAERVVAQGLRALEFPLTYDDGPHGDDTSLRAGVAGLVRRVAQARGLSLAVVAPAGRHCPRCLTEYRPGHEVCGSCPGVAVVG